MLQRLPRLVPRFVNGRAIILSVVTSLILGAPAAFALLDETEGEPEVKDETTEEHLEPEVGEAGPFTYSFDGEKGVLVLDITGTKAGEPAPKDDPDAEDLVCIPVDDTDDESEPTGEPVDDTDEPKVDDEETLPDGCLVIDVTGPNGQINHGTVVSNTVHALKEIRDELDGPLGHYIREIAKSDLGQGVDGSDDDLDDDDKNKDDGAEDDKDDGAKGDKDKEDGEKSNGNGGRPDHAGPPEHAGGQGGPPAHAGGNRGGK